MSELDEIRERLRVVITETCNKVGCEDCDLKWEDSCQAILLQGKEMDLESATKEGRGSHGKE